MDDGFASLFLFDRQTKHSVRQMITFIFGFQIFICYIKPSAKHVFDFANVVGLLF